MKDTAPSKAEKQSNETKGQTKDTSLKDTAQKQTYDTEDSASADHQGELKGPVHAPGSMLINTCAQALHEASNWPVNVDTEEGDI